MSLAQRQTLDDITPHRLPVLLRLKENIADLIRMYWEDRYGDNGTLYLSELQFVSGEKREGKYSMRWRVSVHPKRAAEPKDTIQLTVELVVKGNSVCLEV